VTDTRPAKWTIVQHWAADPQGCEVFAPYFDVDEPCCFACGWYSERWMEGRSARKAWERATLERAHIIPAGLGGASHPGNFLLLCRPCHKDSPDWDEPLEMANWISHRDERPSKEVEHVNTWLRAADRVPLLKPALRELLSRGGTAEDAIGVMRRHVRRAVLHGSELSEGTMEAVLRATARELFP
jgi:hypothetical protein